MFQQEVAERICAEADTPAYGRLSVLAQWTCEARIIMRLPPERFYATAQGLICRRQSDTPRDPTAAGNV